MLTDDAHAEESVKNDGEPKSADGIAQEDLCTDCPIEECRVAGMPRVLVDASCDQLMIFLFGKLDIVVEVRSSCDHGFGTAVLSNHHHEETCRPKFQRHENPKIKASYQSR